MKPSATAAQRAAGSPPFQPRLRERGQGGGGSAGKGCIACSIHPLSIPTHDSIAQAAAPAPSLPLHISAGFGAGRPPRRVRAGPLAAWQQMPRRQGLGRRWPPRLGQREDRIENH